MCSLLTFFANTLCMAAVFEAGRNGQFDFYESFVPIAHENCKTTDNTSKQHQKHLGETSHRFANIPTHSKKLNDPPTDNEWKLGNAIATLVDLAGL